MLLLWFVALVGCDRLECSPAYVPGYDCPQQAQVCCPFLGDTVAGDCELTAGDRFRTFFCDGSDCGNAVLRYAEEACDANEPPPPATQTGPKP